MSAKRIRLAVIDRADADRCIKAWHYSGKPYPKSVIHHGVFLDGVLIGTLQYGDPLDIHKTMRLMAECSRDEFLELNRMALGPTAPKNTSSRALSVSIRMIKKSRPSTQWVVSYSDATQCGDGACYRAAGFLLTGVKRNATLWRAPNGRVVSDVGIRTSPSLRQSLGIDKSRASWRKAGLSIIPGYQIRYIACLTKSSRERLVPDVLPYSAIPDDARMYRGKPIARPRRLARRHHLRRAFDSTAALYVPHQLPLWEP